MKRMKLYDYDHLIDFTDVELTPKEAILFKCHECCCFQGTEVKACDSRDCALWKFKEKWYRNPHKPSEEALKQKQEHMNKIRYIKN